MTAAPAVLALHGFGDSGACWRPFLTRVGLADARAPHLLAHGGRAMPARTAFAHEVLVGDALPAVQAEADRHGRPVVLLGHSLGASTAAGIAATRPDLVAGLLLEDPPWSEPVSPAADAAEEQRNDFLDWLVGLAGTDHAGRVGWVRPRHPGWPDDEVTAWAQAKAQVDLDLFAAAQHWLRRSWEPVAAAVRCPVTLLRGSAARGSACTAGAAARLADLAGWQVVTVALAGHDVRRDAPGAAEAALHALLERAAAS